MKNTFFLLIAALFLTVTAGAQSTVDSIRAKYQLLPMPEPLTIEKTFPVLGAYQLTAADGQSSNVTIKLDSVNKGMIWVEGLPEGNFKAYLKQSPTTYRVISQQSSTGRQVSEGVLTLDTATRTLHIALGKKYDDENPTAIFALAGTEVTGDTAPVTEVKVKSKKGSTKSKTKVVFYTASKVETTPVETAPADTSIQMPEK